MGLLDEVRAEAPNHKKRLCTVGTWYATLTKQKPEVDEVLESGYPAYTICRVLQKHFPGQFGERTFIRHMRKECCCVHEG